MVCYPSAMFHKRYENEDNELFTWKEFANICVTKCVEISTFFASIWACFKSNHRTSDNSIGHACYFKETKAYTTKRRRGSNLDRFRGSLFLYRKSPNLQNHLHFVHTVVCRNHKCKKSLRSLNEASKCRSTRSVWCQCHVQGVRKQHLKLLSVRWVTKLDSLGSY